MAASPSRTPPALALVAMGCAVADLVILALFHVVQRDVDPLRQPVSDYVHGPLGVASPVASMLVGIGALALAAAARIALPRAPRVTIGWALLVVFGLSKLAQAGYPIDAHDGGSMTMHNVLGNLAFFSLPIAVALLTRPLTSSAGVDTPWPSRLVVALLIGLTVLVVAADPGFFGLAQRLWQVAVAGWFILAAVWLRRPSARTGSAPAP